MNRQWAGSTYGSEWLHNRLVASLRVIDVRILYIFSYLFIVPVCLLVNPSRKSAYGYFRERLSFGPLKAAWYTYWNHCRFAETVIDKFAMYAGRKFRTQVPEMGLFNALAAKPDGFVMMSSHIGNYEIAGYSFVSESKSINAVVYEAEKASVMRNRNNMFGRTNVSMIAIRQDMGHLFEINKALGDGNIVSFPTDRNMGGKLILQDFLGAPAEFPMGPFNVAAMRGLDVLTVNVMKTGWTSYTTYVTPLAYDKTAGRKAQIDQISKAYVAELEKQVGKYPEQWYNFFDFWKQ